MTPATRDSTRSEIDGNNIRQSREIRKEIINSLITCLPILFYRTSTRPRRFSLCCLCRFIFPFLSLLPLGERTWIRRWQRKTIDGSLRTDQVRRRRTGGILGGGRIRKDELLQFARHSFDFPGATMELAGQVYGPADSDRVRKATALVKTGGGGFVTALVGSTPFPNIPRHGDW
ncbi:hypothetical protein SETIT_9G222600v2 [Setaria italica]|uniref:Uncharacterized protein n=1 Tax=Setaria italica TaxID=4555 RepID=A0A368SJE3_SETIT|nr:hypothetical protein SETIT_9G222600v2 [Setaria italica]